MTCRAVGGLSVRIVSTSNLVVIDFNSSAPVICWSWISILVPTTSSRIDKNHRILPSWRKCKRSICLFAYHQDDQDWTFAQGLSFKFLIRLAAMLPAGSGTSMPILGDPSGRFLVMMPASRPDSSKGLQRDVELVLILCVDSFDRNFFKVIQNCSEKCDSF